MRTIKEGDVVTIGFINDENITDVTVTHTPSDVGDLWYLEKNGDVWAVNPMSNDFLCFYKKSPGH